MQGATQLRGARPKSAEPEPTVRFLGATSTVVMNLEHNGSVIIVNRYGQRR